MMLRWKCPFLKYPVFDKLSVCAGRCMIAHQLLFFTCVLFHGEHVSQINPLYVHVFGRKNDSDCEFLGWQTNNGSQLPSTVEPVWLLTAAPSSLLSAEHQATNK